MSAPGGAVAQLSRLLALIPWLLARPGVGVDEAAGEFGVTPDQLRKDLELAFVCGTPGHLPDDLIDVQLDGDRIVVSNADAIARPLRLRPDEATALLVGLHTLGAVPGMHQRAALDRATAKLERAAGDAADTASRVAVSVDSDPERTSLLASALEQHRRVRLRYYVPARDEVTEREVDPLRLLVVEGRTYLEAWCRTAEAVRLFRLDRIEQADLLEATAQPPDTAEVRDLRDDLFQPGPDDPRVVLELAPTARWIVDSFPCEEVVELDDGGLRVTLRAGEPGWLVRLVLRLGGSARVLTPATVAEQVAAAAAAARRAYDPPR